MYKWTTTIQSILSPTLPTCYREERPNIIERLSAVQRKERYVYMLSETHGTVEHDGQSFFCKDYLKRCIKNFVNFIV